MRSASEAFKEKGKGRRGSRGDATIDRHKPVNKSQWQVIKPAERNSPILDEMMIPIFSALDKAIDAERESIYKKVKRKK